MNRRALESKVLVTYIKKKSMNLKKTKQWNFFCGALDVFHGMTKS